MNIKKIEYDYNIKIIMITEFGSYLYGCETENSDKDYKGIFIPQNLEDILLNKTPKQIDLSSNKSTSKNSKEDIDLVLYSLDDYLYNLKKSQTFALEMLFSDKLLVQTDEWKYIKSKKSEIVSTNVNALLGYMRSQYSKYSNKTKDLELVQKVLDISEKYNNEKLSVLQSEFEELKIPYRIDKNDLRLYRISGLEFTETIRVKQIKDPLRKIIESTGNRTLSAMKSEGIDWKSIHHALRILTQAKLLLENGEWNYPLPNTIFLKSVKLGNIKYEYVSEVFESLCKEVEDLTLNIKTKDVSKKIDNIQFELSLKNMKELIYYYDINGI